ncbi:MAG: transposase, partial [Pseudomonas shirazensis]
MRKRSSYPKPFKAQVVQECLQPSATVSSVAISHAINANVIRKWMPLYRDQPAATSLPAFVPLKAAARVIAVFGAAKPHCAYLFANRRANRMKVLVHDGVGVWLAARRLSRQVSLARYSPRLRGRTRQRTTPGVGTGFAVAAS